MKTQAESIRLTVLTCAARNANLVSVFLENFKFPSSLSPVQTQSVASVYCPRTPEPRDCD